MYDQGFFWPFREKPKIIEMQDRAKLILHRDDLRFF